MVSSIAFPALLGEMAFMLWLVIMGVNVRKWEERDNTKPATRDRAQACDSVIVLDARRR